MSLQQRIHQVLRSEHAQGAPDATNADVIEAISEALQMAERDLAAADARVARLKHELAKARSGAA